jgi:hypothetical protein
MKAFGLVLLLFSAPAFARGDRPPSPRGNRAVGITFTVMGIVQLALAAALIPLAVSPDDGSDRSIIAAGAGIGGSAACAALSTVFLSIGIPYWVIGQRDLKRTVSLAPNGLTVRF